MDAVTTQEWPLASIIAVTKLHVPARRAGLVARDELVASLGGRRGTRLTLVTGPPGAGKTTLVVQWKASAAEKRPFAWLSLDPDDADPVRFWGCVIEALRTVVPGFGEQAGAALRAGRAALIDAAVPLLINEAAALDQPVVLVLDDLHCLGEADEVHASLGFLLDRLPPSLHIAIATRSEPPLPVARLRARGELTEVGATDLRFSDDHAAALLREGFGIELEPAQVAELQSRTEGWAAGLQLAGVSLGRRGSDFSTFMGAFGGRDADVLAYLAGEMLQAQPPRLREFLLQTSVLERLSAPLCEALTGRNDAAATLEEVERRNLLIVPLDHERRWWRYHHLFAELLRHELEESSGRDEFAALHARAAAWYRDHDEPASAIHHALEGGDTATAAQLVAATWEDTFNRGELTTVATWLSRLPPSSLRRDPQLWLARLWTAMDRGRLEEAEEQLSGAEAGTDPAVRAWGLLLHALHAFKRGDLGGAGDGVARAEELAPPDEFWETVAALVRGLTAYWQAKTSLAYRNFGDARERAAQSGNHLGLAYALGYLALLAEEAGDQPGVERFLAEIEALRLEDGAIAEHFVAFAGALAHGRLLARRGAYEAAVPVLERAASLSSRGAGRMEMADPLSALALVQRARGHHDEARMLVFEAQRHLDACPDAGRLGSRLARAGHEVLGDQGAVPGLDVAYEELSPSELGVLALLPSGLSQREIGQQLFVSVNTVKTHCRNIYAKLRAGSREQAVGRARELGLL